MSQLRKSFYSIKSRMLLICAMILLQGCDGNFSSRTPLSKILSSTLSSHLTTGSFSALGDNEAIDLAPFFSSKRVPDGQSRNSFFESVGTAAGKNIVVHSKFNQAGNFEVFVITADAILMRYEVSPEIYGGSKNALRRFRDTQVRAADIRNAIPAPISGDNGAFWFKRFATKPQIAQDYVSSWVADHVVTTNPSQIGALSEDYAPIYTWGEFIDNNSSIPFVDSGNNKILRIYSQWNECNTEEYEYAQGIGIVAWRGLYSVSDNCAKLGALDTTRQSAMIRNHFTGMDERFYIIHGSSFGVPLDTVVYPTRVAQNYAPGGIFIDDYLYHYTHPNADLLGVLRQKFQSSADCKSQCLSTPQPTPYPLITPLLSSTPPPPPSTPPPEPDPSPIFTSSPSSQVQQLIQQYYSTYLDRIPAQSELDYWVNKILSGSITTIQAQQQIQNSQEAVIRGFYLTYLLRDPDAPGFTFWRTKNDEGLSLEEIRYHFRTSLECKAQCI